MKLKAGYYKGADEAFIALEDKRGDKVKGLNKKQVEKLIADLEKIKARMEKERK